MFARSFTEYEYNTMVFIDEYIKAMSLFVKQFTLR